MTRKHFYEELVGSMRQDLLDLAGELADTYRDIRPFRSAPPAPSRRQQATAFLGMSQQDRQALALQIGPEKYQGMVLENLNQLVEMVGPGAQKLLPYLMAPTPSAPEPDRDTLEAELLGMLDSAEE